MYNENHLYDHQQHQYEELKILKKKCMLLPT